ncbi:Uncharacterized protein HZ326_6679 [Fusarium oxysporum f. sp. albedinis]|nr:Uncharacterized protein HZ326_6679 [Fusarium oxysporum f. sp. albedinis]
MAWPSLDPDAMDAVGETRLFATGDVIDQAEPSHQRQENTRLGTYQNDNSGEQGLSQAEAKIAASVMTRTYT